MGERVGTLLLAFWLLLQSPWISLCCTNTVCEEIPEARDRAESKLATCSHAVPCMQSQCWNMEDYIYNQISQPLLKNKNISPGLLFLNGLRWSVTSPLR